MLKLYFAASACLSARRFCLVRSLVLDSLIIGTALPVLAQTAALKPAKLAVPVSRCRDMSFRAELAGAELETRNSCQRAIKESRVLTCSPGVVTLDDNPGTLLVECFRNFGWYHC